MSHDEPGRHVDEAGRIVTHWPPAGRFTELWERARAHFSDDELHDLLSLISLWRDENATLVAYTDDSGEWVDVEPDYRIVDEWLKGDGA